MRIRNATRGTEIADDARHARSFRSRLIGLLGRSSLEPGEALLLDPCSSIHTAFMRFAIDVIYLDGARRVAKVVPALKPFRVSGMLRGAHSVIELPSGTIASTGSAVGDQLAFESKAPM